MWCLLGKLEDAEQREEGGDEKKRDLARRVWEKRLLLFYYCYYFFFNCACVWTLIAGMSRNDVDQFAQRLDKTFKKFLKKHSSDLPAKAYLNDVGLDEEGEEEEERLGVYEEEKVLEEQDKTTYSKKE